MSGDAVAGRPRPEACGRQTNYLAAVALDPINDANVIDETRLKQGADSVSDRKIAGGPSSGTWCTNPTSMGWLRPTGRGRRVTRPDVRTCGTTLAVSDGQQAQGHAKP